MTAHTHDQPPAHTPPRQSRYWLVIRIVDYRLQAVTMDDGQPTWEDLSDATWVTTDRDAAYQLGRSTGGLLLSARGLPSPRQLQAYAAGLHALESSAS